MCGEARKAGTGANVDDGACRPDPGQVQCHQRVGQMIIQTLISMIVPSQAPTPMPAMPWLSVNALPN